jgi:hypothetical protein
MKKLFIGLILACCDYALAGTGQGTIAKIELGPGHRTKVYISLAGPVSGQPSCSANATYPFVFDTAQPGGKDTLAMVLLAKSTNQFVTIAGLNQCTLVDGQEDVRFIRFE